MKIEYGDGSKLTGEIVRGILVSQTFQPKFPLLKSIYIEFGTYCNNQLTCDVVVEILRQGQTVKSIKQSASKFKDNQFHEFLFNVELLPSMTYDLRIHSENGNFGNCVTAKWGRQKSPYNIMISGTKQRGELHCVFDYVADQKIPDELTENKSSVQYQRISGLGDVLVTLPLIKALKLRDFNKNIIYYTRVPELLDNVPYIDKVYQTDKEVPTAKNITYQIPHDNRESIFDYWDKEYQVNTRSNFYRGEIYFNKKERELALENTGDFVAVNLEVASYSPVKNLPNEYKEKLINDLTKTGIRIKLFGNDKSYRVNKKVIDLRGLDLRESMCHFSGCMSLICLPSFFWHLSRAFYIPTYMISTGYEDPRLMDREFTNINVARKDNCECEKYPCLLDKVICPDYSKCLPDYKETFIKIKDFVTIKRKRAFITGSLGDTIAMMRGIDTDYKWRFLIYSPAHKLVKSFLESQSITDDIIVLDDKIDFGCRPVTLAQWEEKNGNIIAEDLSIHEYKNMQLIMRQEYNNSKYVNVDACYKPLTFVDKCREFVSFPGEAFIFHRITLNTPGISQRNFNQTESDRVLTELISKNYKVVIIGTLEDDKLYIPKHDKILDARGATLPETLKIIEMCSNYIGPISGPSNWCWAKNINLNYFILKKGFQKSDHKFSGAWHGYDNREFYYPGINRYGFSWFWDDEYLNRVKPMQFKSEKLIYSKDWELPSGPFIFAVSCYNRFEIVKKSLMSLAKSLKGLDAELLLQDDGSTELGMKKWLQNFNEIKTIHIRNDKCALKRRSGTKDAWQFCRNDLHNHIESIGVNKYRCIFFLDDDALYNEGWAQRILMLWKWNTDTSIKCYSAYHNFHPYGMEFPGSENILVSPFGYYRKRYWNAGINYMIPSEFLHEIGHFSLNNEAGDIDLLNKAKRNNWRALVTVPSGVQHIGNTSTLAHDCVDRSHDFMEM